MTEDTVHDSPSFSNSNVRKVDTYSNSVLSSNFNSLNEVETFDHNSMYDSAHDHYSNISIFDTKEFDASPKSGPHQTELTEKLPVSIALTQNLGLNDKFDVENHEDDSISNLIDEKSQNFISSNREPHYFQSHNFPKSSYEIKSIDSIQNDNFRTRSTSKNDSPAEVLSSYEQSTSFEDYSSLLATSSALNSNFSVTLKTQTDQIVSADKKDVEAVNLVGETNSMSDKHINALESLKKLALEAKSRGDLESAKKYMSDIIALRKSSEYSGSTSSTNMDVPSVNNLRKRLDLQIQRSKHASRHLHAAGDMNGAATFGSFAQAFESDLISFFSTADSSPASKAAGPVPKEFYNKDISNSKVEPNIHGRPYQTTSPTAKIASNSKSLESSESKPIVFQESISLPPLITDAINTELEAGTLRIRVLCLKSDALPTTDSKNSLLVEDRRSIRRVKESYSGDQHKHFLRIYSEWPAVEDSERSENFKEDKTSRESPQFIFINGTAQDALTSWTGASWSGFERESLGTCKFVEHRKLKIELFQIIKCDREPTKNRSFFSRLFSTESKAGLGDQILMVGSSTFRVNDLLHQNKMIVEVRLMDANRKSLNLVAKLFVETRSALSSKSFARKTIDPSNWSVECERRETWSFIANGRSGPAYKASILNNGTKNLDSIDLEEVINASYVVLENEIERLQGSDPNIVQKRQALQARLVQLTDSVDCGALDMETYVQQVKTALGIAKRKAVSLKKANDKEGALDWLRRVRLMESEIAEVDGL